MSFQRKPSAGPKIDARRKAAREKAAAKRATDKEFVSRDRESSRRRSRAGMLKKFNLSEREATAMLAAQQNRCSICGGPFTDYAGPKRAGKPLLDHSHTTKNVRGFLCQHCNSMLGFARERFDILRAAITYLKTTTGPLEKIWGQTECLIATPSFELHRLTIRPLHRCSLHIHRSKANLFYVLKGILYVDIIKSDTTPTVTIKLGAGDHTTIAPGVHHQFRTGLTPCVALEMYYTEPLSEDIVRRNVGGPV